MPWMRYQELGDDGEHEMNDLLDSNVQRSVTINGRTINKKHISKKKQHMNEQAAKQDPLSNLGYGIVAYVNILYTMIWVFAAFSILVIPTIMAFKSGTAYEGDAHAGYAGSMVSNLGYSGT